MPSMPRADWIERGKKLKFLRREQISGCGRNGPIAWNAYELVGQGSETHIFAEMKNEAPGRQPLTDAHI